MATGTQIHRASVQWATRPDDERFESLDELSANVAARRRRSYEPTVPLPALRIGYTDAGELTLNDSRATSERCTLSNPSGTGYPDARLTHYSAGQLCQRVGAPVGYLRQLPAPLAAINLQYGLEQSKTAGKLLLTEPVVTGEATEFRAVTSETYGRIWDAQVVDQVVRLNAQSDGRWQIPSASYQAKNPKRATTLYASDHDVFIFLVDPNTAIEVDGETLYRGFITWNSETGAHTFGLQTFLYRTVCDNRIIWGARNVNELTIRHTKAGPERFAWQAAPALAEYAKSGTSDVVNTIHAAKEIHVASKVADVEKWLVDRGFTQQLAKQSVKLAEDEEGDPTQLWNVVQGVTAAARGISHTDDRVEIERKAGKLLNQAAEAVGVAA